MTPSKVILFIFISILGNKAYCFDLHYKNINSILAYLCHSTQENTLKKSQVRVNKFSIEKNTLDQKALKTEFTITGYCNQIVNLKTKKIVKYGQEIFLNFTYNKKLRDQKFSGELGINSITIKLKNRMPYTFKITKNFINSSSIYNFANSQWAKSDSLFSLKKDLGIKIKMNSRIIASESEQTLHFTPMSKHYDIWNYETYGCDSLQNIKQVDCEALSLIP